MAAHQETSKLDVFTDSYYKISIHSWPGCRSVYLRSVLAGNGSTSLLDAGDWDNWTLDTRQHRSGGIITHHTWCNDSWGAEYRAGSTHCAGFMKKCRIFQFIGASGKFKRSSNPECQVHCPGSTTWAQSPLRTPPGGPDSRILFPSLSPLWGWT